MQRGLVLVGGAYFTDERIGFFGDDYGNLPDNFYVSEVSWAEVKETKTLHGVNGCDFAFVFGIKSWVRKLKKKRMSWKRIVATMCRFLERNIPKAMPMGMLDDCNLTDEEHIGDQIRKWLFENMNCKVFLLREYLKTKTYDKRVIPFSIPCKDNTDMGKPYTRKIATVYFNGNDSHPDRKQTINFFNDFRGSHLHVYSGGEKSKDKVPYKDYLYDMSNSKICLSFPGAGYCTFRYQEIASVGSIIASKNYPILIRNDYFHGFSCLRYKYPNDLLIHMENEKKMIDIQQASIEHFKKYHTTEVRFNEWMEHLNEICRD